VLLVDDEPVSREVSPCLLAWPDCRWTFAEDGAAGAGDGAPQRFA
jgi:CheY-like chemotaxis protein